MPLKTWLLKFFVISLSIVPMLSAQVNGLSYTISPLGQYTFWDEKAGLADNLGIGASLGFGFGELVELSENSNNYK